MTFEIFTALVAFLALIYAGMAKFIQNKLVNREELEAMQAESKKLNEEVKKAQESKNQKKIDEAMKKQMDFLPKMSKTMMSQFKPMIVIMALFFAFTWAVGYINPLVEDDITIVMNDDGEGCDELAGDGIYSACYELEDMNYGKWMYNAKAFNQDNEIGSNYTYFNYNSEEVDNFTEMPHGEPVYLSTDKKEYSAGETVKLYAENGNADRMEAVLDNGTYFSVVLPLAIPILNVKTIYQPYWWFILISLIANLSISFAMGKLRKKK
ncbi:DUF106 domain-containing protein [Candidatus Micrarchaeota archaeon]|nr:DUF106 domain-containing protein [Candidatus Micrarchaeota archaeon]